MNAFKQTLILSALALSGAAALADDITMEDRTAVSTRSRAEVRAELRQARADGTLLGGGEQPGLRDAADRPGSALTREQVRMQLGKAPWMLIASLYGAP